MEISFYQVLVIACCYQSTASYTKYELESFNLCGHGKEASSIYIPPWRAAILRLNPDGSQPSRNIHKCKVKINTQKGFGLAAVVEKMKIRGTRNYATNGWICEDYIKLSTPGKSFISKLLDTLLPGDVFKSKATEELCGVQQTYGMDNTSYRLTEVGSHANTLSTLAEEMTVEFHQSKTNTRFINNSFTIVITTYKHESEKEACQGKLLCQGRNTYCIDPRYACDTHVNCAFPNSGSDEQSCKVTKIQHPIFSTTTTIITVLAGIVVAGLVVFCLFSLIMRIKSRNNTPSQTPVPPLSDPTAPALERQHTLPHYEAVVMADIGPGWKVEAPPSPGPGECPPSYHTLFPDGPPKQLDGANATVPKDNSTNP